MSRLDDANNDLNLSMRQINNLAGVSNVDVIALALVRVIGSIAVTAAMAYDAEHPASRSVVREAVIYIELLCDFSTDGDWVVRLCTIDDRVIRHLDARYRERADALKQAECFARALGLDSNAENEITSTGSRAWVKKS